MKKMLMTIALLAAMLGMAAQLKVQNYSFKEKTMADKKNPGINDDPGFYKLTDGKKNLDTDKRKSAGRVIWQHKTNQGKAPIINFFFKNPVKLDKVNIHYFRWKRSYGIKSVELVGLTVAGKKVFLGKAVLNHPYAKPEKDPYYSDILIPVIDATPVDSVSVIFKATGGYLALEEVEFFGSVVQQSTKSAQPIANPLDKFSKSNHKDLRIYRDGEQFIMENDRVIFGIDPRCSGTVNYAYDKLGKCNLILYSPPNSGYGGMFQDRFYPGSYAVRDMYRYITYKAEIITDKLDEKQLRLIGVGKSGIYSNIKIEKLYTLKKNSSLLQVDYSITNGKDNVVPLNKGFWSAAGVGVSGEYNRIYPGAYRVSVTPGIRQLSTRDISDRWFGVISGNHVLTVLSPWNRLKEIYYWGENEYQGTVECKLGIYPIKAGESLNFTMHLATFSGIGVPDKVDELGAGSFSLAQEYQKIPSQLNATFNIFQPGRYTILISGGILKNGKVNFQKIAEKNLNGEILVKFPFNPIKGAGTHVYKAEIWEGKQLRFTMLSSAVMERNTGLYQLPSPGEKLPDASADKSKLELNFNSQKYATKHIKWGKPFSGGKIKVLAINAVTGGIRDMIELSQRFDIDLTTNFTAGLWSLSDHVMSLNEKDCISELAKKLKKDYDVIVVSFDAWDMIGKELSTVILAKVAKGTGLIVTDPISVPDALKSTIHSTKKKLVKSDKLTVVDNHCLLAGLPLEKLPFGRLRHYEKLGNSMIKSGNTTLLGNFNYGKGKVYAFSYPVSKNIKTHYNRSATFFLPLLNYEDVNIPQYDYHEYQMALWGRLLFDAAKRSSNILSGDITIKNGGGATLELNAKSAIPVEYELTLRNKFSEVAGRITGKSALVAGKNHLPINIKTPTMNGLHFADIIVRSKAGVEWWGSVAFEHSAPSAIVKVNFTNRIYKKEETLQVTAVSTGTGELRFRLFDSEGNEFARNTGNKAALPLSDCRTPVCFLVTELTQNGQLIDKVKQRIELYQTPDPRRFNIALGWPGIGTKAQEAFLDSYVKQMKKFGINCTSGSGSSRDSMIAERHFRNNGIVYSSVQISNSFGVGGKRPFDTKKIVKSKFDLIRTPCLSQMGYKKLLEQSVTAHHYINYGVLYIPGPDEANMFTEWDGCFSEDCQKAFREYLKKEYSSLQALNSSWDTNFKSWDEVVALTSQEVRKKKSFAAWLDHRTFNDWNRADAFAHLMRGIKKTAPGLKYCLSGSSETNPWNAWDYYRLMQHLDAMSTYEGEQVIQQRSFCDKKIVSTPWIGYDADFDSMNQRVFTFMMNGACGFNIYGTFNINPDFTISRGGRDVIKVLKQFWNGPAEALMGMRVNSAPIAFYYSPASIKLNWILGFSNLYKSSVVGFRQLLEDAGLQYDYVAYGQLEKSGVPEKYRILVMPMTSAISDKEAAAVAEFVRRGGIVLGDFLTGTYDQHGKKRAVPALNKVFGINSQGNWHKQNVVMTGDGELAGLKLNTEFVETGVSAANAQIIAHINGQGTGFSNNFGKGRAIYFANSAMASYGNLQGLRYAPSNRKNSALLNQLAGRIFSRYAITSPALVPELNNSSCYSFSAKNVLAIGIVRDIAQTKLIEQKAAVRTVKLAKKAHVYDLINHKYIGYGDSFKYEFAPTTQSIFILLPYKGESVGVKFTSDGAKLTLNAKTNDFANHLFHVQLIAPDGKSNPAFDTVVFGENNEAFYRFKKPLNAKSGQWKLKVTEVLTSLHCEVPLP